MNEQSCLLIRSTPLGFKKAFNYNLEISFDLLLIVAGERKRKGFCSNGLGKGRLTESIVQLRLDLGGSRLSDLHALI